MKYEVKILCRCFVEVPGGVDPSVFAMESIVVSRDRAEKEDCVMIDQSVEAVERIDDSATPDDLV